MHARLTIGAGVIMVSDSPPNAPAATESNVHVCLQFNDLADMTAKFEALARGGTVTMPVQDTFWGAKFGQLTDAFGVHWMFNYEIDHT
jgi:PhnB protein